LDWRPWRSDISVSAYYYLRVVVTCFEKRRTDTFEILAWIKYSGTALGVDLHSLAPVSLFCLGFKAVCISCDSYPTVFPDMRYKKAYLFVNDEIW
jgi:hypothetical protein